MSRESLDAIATAIGAHLAEQSPEAVLTDWFISYAYMSHDADVNGGIVHSSSYATSDSSPHGALGIATIGLQALTYDITPDEDDD